MTKLSDYVLQFVADQGVKHVFLVTGGGAMHLNASLAKNASLEAICNSHEQASAMAADRISVSDMALRSCTAKAVPSTRHAAVSSGAVIIAQ